MVIATATTTSTLASLALASLVTTPSTPSLMSAVASFPPPLSFTTAPSRMLPTRPLYHHPHHHAPIVNLTLPKSVHSLPQGGGNAPQSQTPSPNVSRYHHFYHQLKPHQPIESIPSSRAQSVSQLIQPQFLTPASPSSSSILVNHSTSTFATVAPSSPPASSGGTHFCIHRLCIRQNGQASTGVEICYNDKGDVVRHGEQYVPLGIDTCTQCTCMNGKAEMCISVLCSPPENCRKYEEISNKCCEFLCMDHRDNSMNGLGTFNNKNSTGISMGTKILSTSHQPSSPPFNTSPNLVFPLGLRLIASTITSFLILALLLFMIHRLRQRRLLLMIRRLQNRRIDGPPGANGAGGVRGAHPHQYPSRSHSGHLLNDHVFHFGYFGLASNGSSSSGAPAAGANVRPSDSEDNFGYIEPPPPYVFWKPPEQQFMATPSEAPPTYEETISTNIASFPVYFPSEFSQQQQQQQQSQQIQVQAYPVLSAEHPSSAVGVIQLHNEPRTTEMNSEQEINSTSVPYYPTMSNAHQQLSQHLPQHLSQTPQSSESYVQHPLVRHNSMPPRPVSTATESQLQRFRQSITARNQRNSQRLQQHQQFFPLQQQSQQLYHIPPTFQQQNSSRFFSTTASTQAGVGGTRPGLAVQYNETLPRYGPGMNEMVVETPDHITVVHIGRDSTPRYSTLAKSCSPALSTASSIRRSSDHRQNKKSSKNSPKSPIVTSSNIPTPQTPEYEIERESSNSMTSLLLSPNNNHHQQQTSKHYKHHHKNSFDMSASSSASVVNLSNISSHSSPLTTSPTIAASSAAPATSSSSSSSTVISSGDSSILLQQHQQQYPPPTIVMRRSSLLGTLVGSSTSKHAKSSSTPVCSPTDSKKSPETVQIPLKCDPRTISRL